MWPQYFFLSIMFIGLLIAAHQHGKPRTGKHDFWIQAISTAVSLVVLYYGGFFNKLF